MSNGEMYYALSLYAASTGTAAYYSVQPDRNLQILQGAASFAPTGQATTSVAIYPQVMQLQLPPSAVISAGVTIVTDADVIAGMLTVSPAIDAPVTLTLYGAGGNVIGSTQLNAGDTQAPFSWSVSASNAIPKDEVDSVLSTVAKIPPRS